MPLLLGLTLFSLASQDTARIRVMMDVEDSRPAPDRTWGLAPLNPLLTVLHHEDRRLAAWAVRGLGRQQRPDLIPWIAHVVTNRDRGFDPDARREAINALGQVALIEGTDTVRTLLVSQVAASRSELGTILRTLGRLPVPDRSMRDSMEALLVGTGLAPGNDDLIETGALHGLASLYRRTASRHPPSDGAVARIASRTARPHGAMTRRLAMAALVAAGRADSTVLHAALGDPEREVRRLAALAAFAQADLPGREGIIERAWSDSSFAVRYEALRGYARHVVPREGCGRILSALDDPDGHVALLGIDLLGGCGQAVIPRLTAIAREPILDDRWHRPSHALVAAARIDSSAAGALLPAFTRSTVWWARMYAARAADTAGMIPVLSSLARDPHPNVREAAIAGLRRRVGHAADSLYVAALESADYQLLLTAAQALDSSTDRGAPEALAAALTRVTADRRETSRDPRVAILTTLERVAAGTHADLLRHYARDFDTTVAILAARLASRRSATVIAPAPNPLPRQPVPSWADLAGWDKLVAVIEMKGGGLIRLKLRPFDAPTNVARFIRMAREGWFNGLTWHRVVPNFVVQGGSPGANEYMGDGPFFFNLIDNWRLDHDYTIIAEVVDGMHVVDAMQEGATIRRVTLIADPP